MPAATPASAPNNVIPLVSRASNDDNTNRNTAGLSETGSMQTEPVAPAKVSVAEILRRKAMEKTNERVNK
jgi:hypothetical protein